VELRSSTQANTITFEDCLPRCDAAVLGERLLTFQRNIVPSSLVVKRSMENAKIGSVPGVYKQGLSSGG
jgi:hypothetical protein